MERKGTCKDCHQRFPTTKAFLAHRRHRHGDEKGLDQDAHEQQAPTPKPNAEHPDIDIQEPESKKSQESAVKSLGQQSKLIQEEVKSVGKPETVLVTENDVETTDASSFTPEPQPKMVGEHEEKKKDALDQEEQELLAILHSEGWIEPKSVSAKISF